MDARERIHALVKDILDQGITQYNQVLTIALMPAIFILEKEGVPAGVSATIYPYKERVALDLLRRAYTALIQYY